MQLGLLCLSPCECFLCCAEPSRASTLHAASVQCDAAGAHWGPLGCFLGDRVFAKSVTVYHTPAAGVHDHVSEIQGSVGEEVGC